MNEFITIVAIGVLIYIYVQLKSRFDKIDNNLTVLNRKIDALKSKEKHVQKQVLKTETIDNESYQPSIPIISIAEKPIETISKDYAETTFVPLNQEENIPKEIEKVAFSNDAANNLRPAAIRIQPEKTEPELSFWEKFKEKNPDLEKFIGENIINKIGILILVLGISYFVKYSIDKGWIPTPARVGLGILAGVLVLGVAHKLREKYAAFSSVFVGGAIAIFYFTIGIAFHDYKLFGQEIAFAIMVLITGFSAFITIAYNRLELAILTLIGGFAVPFMVSTGAGNYVVLFIYILILNTGILSIAYHKKWSVLNTIAFVFTVLLFGGWILQEINEQKPHYVGGLLFAFAFYLMFTAINIINNLKTNCEFSKSQLGMIAANTFLFYGAGMTILTHFHPEFRGLFTTFLAGLNLVYAWFLFKKFGIDKTTVYLLIGMTLTFVTLAIPIQFSNHYITMFWAAESVLLLWMSQKSGIKNFKFGAIIVQILMFFSLFMDWNHFYGGTTVLQIIANPIFITGLLAIASCFVFAHLLKNETETTKQFGFEFNPNVYQKSIFVAGLILAYFVGMFEVNYQSCDYLNNSVSASAFPALYHLIFTAILCQYLSKSNSDNSRYGIVFIAVANIVMFTFFFSHFAFSEHNNYISTGISQRIAFYLHYVMLGITVYFCYLLYQLYKENQISEYFKKPIFVWLIAFFIVFIASTEMMLHGLILNNNPITIQDVLKENSSLANNPVAIESSKLYLANDMIHGSRQTIIKTSFPVLWGVLAFIFLIIGIKKPSKIIRIIALSLLGLTILKLFVYDISNVSETGKIVAFILLGVLVLIISFVYQKLKILVTDDKTENENL